MLDEQLQAKDTTSFWCTWSEATEQGFVDYLSSQENNECSNGPNWKAYRGRGTPVYKQRHLRPCGAAAPIIPGWQHTTLGGTSATVRRQVRRLQQLQQSIRANHGLMRETCLPWSDWHTLNGKEVARICYKIYVADATLKGRERIQNPFLLSSIAALSAGSGEAAGPCPEVTTTSPLQGAPTGVSPAIIEDALTNELQRYQHLLTTLANNDRQKRIQKVRRRLRGPDGINYAFERLKTNHAQPIRAVFRPDGTVTADPVEVDAITTHAWKRIYDGTGRTHEAVVNAYKRVNQGAIYERTSPFEVPAITGRDLRNACRIVRLIQRGTRKSMGLGDPGRHRPVRCCCVVPDTLADQ